MRCPVCEKENKVSRVYVKSHRSTMAWNEPYYDEGGAYHHHDLNWHTTELKCSNGHRFEVSERSRCPSGCGFGGENRVEEL